MSTYRGLEQIILIEHASYFAIFTSIFSRDNAMSDEIMTLKEAADYLKLAEKTAYRLAAEGKLPGFKVGGSWRFKREDILKWIEEQKIIRGTFR